jgi:hypothetical protein
MAGLASRVKLNKERAVARSIQYKLKTWEATSPAAAGPFFPYAKRPPRASSAAVEAERKSERCRLGRAGRLALRRQRGVRGSALQGAAVIVSRNAVTYLVDGHAGGYRHVQVGAARYGVGQSRRRFVAPAAPRASGGRRSHRKHGAGLGSFGFGSLFGGAAFAGGEQAAGARVFLRGRGGGLSGQLLGGGSFGGQQCKTKQRKEELAYHNEER